MKVRRNFTDQYAGCFAFRGRGNFLNFQKCRALALRGDFRLGAADVAEKLADRVLMGITDDPRHTLKTCNFFRRALGVASRHQDFTIRVRAVNAPNHLPDLGIRVGGDRASVQDRNLTLFHAAGFLEACGDQPRLDPGSRRNFRCASSHR